MLYLCTIRCFDWRGSWACDTQSLERILLLRPSDISMCSAALISLSPNNFVAVYLPFPWLSGHLLLNVCGLLICLFLCLLAELKDGQSRSAQSRWPPLDGAHSTPLTCFPPTRKRCKLLRRKGCVISVNSEWPSGMFTFRGTD